MSGDPVLVAIVGGALLLWYGASYVVPRLMRSRGPKHRHVVEALRLLKLDPRYYGVSPVGGRVDGVNVVISEKLGLTEQRDTGPEIHVGIVEDLPLPLRLSTEALLPALLRGTDTPTGEPRFDERVRVDADDPLAALAMLDGATRDAVAAAVADGAVFDGRSWTLSIHDVTWTGARIAQAVRALVRAHRALSDASSRANPAGLAAIAVGDRHAGVRYRALALLIERGIASRSVLESRTTDVDPGIRYVAARALGADGVGTLRTIVRGGSRSWKVRAAAALTTLSLAPEAAREVEDVLAGALADPELADPALLGLARVGTARSIEPLKRAVAEGATADLRRAARDVLTQVRGRLDPARAGGLSLAAGEQGGLSEVTAEHGGVSVVHESEP